MLDILDYAKKKPHGTIKEFLDRYGDTPLDMPLNIPFPCFLTDVNMREEYDVNDLVEYDNEDDEAYTFLERVLHAEQTVIEICDQLRAKGDLSLYSFLKYLKKDTTDDNAHYWGCFLFVYTNYTEEEMKEATALYIGVRMD